MPSNWYLQSPKYYSGNENQIVSDVAQSGFAELLAISPEAYNVTVNGVSSRIIIQNKSDKNDVKKVRARINDVKIGDLVIHKNLTWLVTTYMDDNTMHSFGEMEMCSTSLIIKGKPTRTRVGIDPSGKPIYEDVDGPTKSYPCVVSNKLLRASVLDNELNLPKGMIIAKIPYDANPDIEEHNTCRIFDFDYRIVDLDLSDTFELSGSRFGVLNVLASRVQQE